MSQQQNICNMYLLKWSYIKINDVGYGNFKYDSIFICWKFLFVLILKIKLGKIDAILPRWFKMHFSSFMNSFNYRCGSWNQIVGVSPFDNRCLRKSWPIKKMFFCCNNIYIWCYVIGKHNVLYIVEIPTTPTWRNIFLVNVIWQNFESPIMFRGKSRNVSVQFIRSGSVNKSRTK